MCTDGNFSGMEWPAGEHQSLYSSQAAAVFTGVYALIFVVGLCGNVCTCLVVWRRPYMYVQAPFYVNLALCDLLLLLVGLPADVHFIWSPYRPIGGGWFCVLRAILTESATNASVLTIISFTAERWLTICHPFQSSNTVAASVDSTRRQSKYIKLLCVVWIVSVLAASPLSYQMDLVSVDELQSCQLAAINASFCVVKKERFIPYSFEMSSLLFFAFPMVLMGFFYTSILVELRRTISRQPQVDDSPVLNAAKRVRQQAKASGAVVKILLAVVVAFFLCFLPHHLQRLMASHKTSDDDERSASFHQMLFLISGISYYVSTAVNTVIYCLLSKRFRFALKTILSCRRRKRRRRNDRFNQACLFGQAANGRSGGGGGLAAVAPAGDGKHANVHHHYNHRNQHHHNQHRNQHHHHNQQQHHRRSNDQWTLAAAANFDKGRFLDASPRERLSSASCTSQSRTGRDQQRSPGSLGHPIDDGNRLRVCQRQRQSQSRHSCNERYCVSLVDDQLVITFINEPLPVSTMSNFA